MVHIRNSSINQRCIFSRCYYTYECIQSNDRRPVYEAIAEHPRYTMGLVRKFERILKKQVP